MLSCVFCWQRPNVHQHVLVKEAYIYTYIASLTSGWDGKSHQSVEESADNCFL